MRALLTCGSRLYVAGDFTTLMGYPSAFPFPRRNGLGAFDLDNGVPRGAVSEWDPDPDGEVNALDASLGTAREWAPALTEPVTSLAAVRRPCERDAARDPGLDLPGKPAGVPALGISYGPDPVRSSVTFEFTVPAAARKWP